MFKVYEFEIYLGEQFYIAEPFGLDGGTQGESFDETVEMAADWLKGMIEFWDIRGIEPPVATFGNVPRHGGEKVVIGVEAGRHSIEKMAASTAARELGVTPGRVTQLLAANQLEGWRDGRNTYVTADSVRARLADMRKDEQVAVGA